MMTPAEAWALARQRLATGLAREVPEDALFIADDDVNYGQPHGIVIRRSALRGLDAEWWTAMLEPRPPWLHFNLLGIDRGRSILSVRRSAAVIAPENPQTPAVNVSSELTPARFVDI